MPKFEVLQKSFIGNRIVEEGEIVDYDGEPSDNLKPVDKAAKKAAESVDADASAAESAERLAAAANTGSPDGVVDADASAAESAERLAAAANTGSPDGVVDADASAGQGETTGEAQP